MYNVSIMWHFKLGLWENLFLKYAFQIGTRKYLINSNSKETEKGNWTSAETCAKPAQKPGTEYQFCKSVSY